MAFRDADAPLCLQSLEDGTLFKDVEPDKVRGRFKHLCLLLHPDKHADKVEGARLFKLLQDNYQPFRL